MLIKNIIRFVPLFLLLSTMLEASSGLPQFDTTKFPQQLFWLTIFFGITYIFISFFVIPRIKKLKTSRSNIILGNVERSLKIKKDIETIEQQITAVENDVRAKTQSIYDALSKKIVALTKVKAGDLSVYREDAKSVSEQKMADYKDEISKDYKSQVEDISSFILNKLEIKLKK